MTNGINRRNAAVFNLCGKDGVSVR